MSQGQSEGQDFCGKFDGDSYFPLDIEKKKIVWSKSSYIETATSWVKIDSIEYLSVVQVWQSGQTDTLYLREEDGTVYQYQDYCDSESVRFKADAKVGDSWSTCDQEIKYTVISKKGKLKTPFCDYKKLVIIKAEYPDVIFHFYYKKGYGYIGATVNGTDLISFVSPKW
jgi:hypothetical protein